MEGTGVYGLADEESGACAMKDDYVNYARWTPDDELLHGDADENGTVDVTDAFPVDKQ